MTEHRTWPFETDDDIPPWWWMAQHWHWLWRLEGQLIDREYAYWCALMQRLEREVR